MGDEATQAHTSRGEEDVADEGDDANMGDEATQAHTSRGEEDDADLLIFVERLGENKASSEENVLSLETREVCVWDGFFERSREMERWEGSLCVHGEGEGCAGRWWVLRVRKEFPPGTLDIAYRSMQK
ncbi:hypothetical protein AAC387_Pa07g1878 [Persea americana]